MKPRHWRDELSCNYTVKTMLLKERQSDISIIKCNSINKKCDDINFLYLFGGFALANKPGKYIRLTTC